MNILEYRVKIMGIDIAAAKVAAVEENAEAIAQKVRDQLRAGTEQDRVMPAYKNSVYAEYKASLPSYIAPFPKTDLFLTGDFHRGIVCNIVSNTQYVIDSTDRKTTDLIAKYGQGILELSRKSIISLRKPVTKSFVKNLISQISKSKAA